MKLKNLSNKAKIGSKQTVMPKNDNDNYELSYENWTCAVRNGRCKVSYEQYLKNGIVYGPN